MIAAQEMFRDANKVTKPEKALILGFMAGARGILFVVHLARLTFVDKVNSVLYI